MPKPLILRRPSGLYARFEVPVDLRQAVGRTYLVRPLRAHADHARLAAAQIAVALSQAFDAWRGGALSSDELKAFASGLKALQGGNARDYKVRFGGMEIEATDEADHRRAMEMAAMLSQSAPVAVVPPAGKSLLLRKAIADHVADLEREKLDGRTVDDSRHTLRLLAGIVGDGREVSTITQDDLRAFIDGVRYWPRNASKIKPYRDLSVLDAIALAKANNVPAPKGNTFKKHRERLSVFFNALLRSKFITENPLHGMRGWPDADDEDGGRPFGAGELALIFEPARFTTWAKKYPHRWFGVMLGLYSGARVTEIAQLQIADIEQVDGVWGFSVRRRAELRQKAKNKASLRFVPIAKPVLEAGFLKYIAEAQKAGHIRLFPNLPNATGLGFGRALSRQFSDYIKKQCDITDAGLGFHGFRHTLASELDRIGATLPAIAAITGHTVEGQAPVLSDFYIRKTLPDRVATLAKFRPLVELPKYKPDQFRRALRNAPVVLDPIKPRARKLVKQ